MPYAMTPQGLRHPRQFLQYCNVEENIPLGIMESWKNAPTYARLRRKERF